MTGSLGGEGILTGRGGASKHFILTDRQLNFSVNFISFVQGLWNHLEKQYKFYLHTAKFDLKNEKLRR